MKTVKLGAEFPCLPELQPYNWGLLNLEGLSVDKHTHWVILIWPGLGWDWEK